MVNETSSKNIPAEQEAVQSTLPCQPDVPNDFRPRHAAPARAYRERPSRRMHLLTLERMMPISQARSGVTRTHGMKPAFAWETGICVEHQSDAWRASTPHRRRAITAPRVLFLAYCPPARGGRGNAVGGSMPFSRM